MKLLDIAFWDSFSQIKYDDLDMVMVIITKMDHFLPGEGPWLSVQDIESDIRETFRTEVGIDRVIFCNRTISKVKLFNAIINELKNMPQRQLWYNDTEILEHFGITQKTCSQKIEKDSKAELERICSANKHRLYELDEAPRTKRRKADQLYLDISNKHEALSEPKLDAMCTQDARDISDKNEIETTQEENWERLHYSSTAREPLLNNEGTDRYSPAISLAQENSTDTVTCGTKAMTSLRRILAFLFRSKK